MGCNWVLSCQQRLDNWNCWKCHVDRSSDYQIWLCWNLISCTFELCRVYSDPILFKPWNPYYSASLTERFSDYRAWRTVLFEWKAPYYCKIQGILHSFFGNMALFAQIVQLSGRTLRNRFGQNNKFCTGMHKNKFATKHYYNFFRSLSVIN